MFEELDELIHREMERSRLPGLTIALVRGNEIVWSNGYGCADLETEEPVNPETVFSVASVTKPVVTTALMRWHDEGRFQLDDPVNEHLAPLRLRNEWEETNPVTIRHLLTHTSGLPVDVGAYSPEAANAKTLEEFLAAVTKTVRPPGEEIVYANWGYDTVGYLVGRFGGRPYDEYLHERVLEPLGMESSRIGWPPEGKPAARGYFLSALDGEHHAAKPFEWGFEPASPAGSLYSTVEDLGRFLIAQLNGGVYRGCRILSEAGVSEMHRLHARAGRSEGGMGLGFRVERVRGRHLICHAGDGADFTTFIGAHPEEKVGVVVLTNMGRAQTARSVIANAALRTLLDEPSERTPPTTHSDGFDWERLEGRYLSNFWAVEADVAAGDGMPTVTMRGGFIAREEGERSHLKEDGDGVIRAHDGPFDGFELTFEFDDDGMAARFYGGVYSFTFERTGDVPLPVESVVDEDADVAGRWAGTVDSPLGPIPVALNITGFASATITVLSAQDATVEEFNAEGGRVSGRTDVSVPGLGEFRVFLRLRASGGQLVGKSYARGTFGETPMKTELRLER